MNGFLARLVILTKFTKEIWTKALLVIYGEQGTLENGIFSTKNRILSMKISRSYYNNSG